MSGSAASADSRLRQACGGRAHRSVLQRTSSSTPQSFTAPRARLARDYALSRRTVMKSAGARLLKKVSEFVLSRLSTSTYRKGTPRRSNSLRPCHRTFLSSPEEKGRRWLWRGNGSGNSRCTVQSKEPEPDASGEPHPRRVHADGTLSSVILPAPFFRSVQGPVQRVTQWASFGLNDLEALVIVAREAKEWIFRSRLEALR